jgi:hypothetical protein
LQRRAAKLAERRAAAAPSSEEATRLAERRVTAAELAVSEARAQLEAAEQRLSEATRRGESLAALAVQALELLGPTCPVCGQSIDEHDVREDLHKRLADESDGELAAAVAARNAVRSRVVEGEQELAAAQKAAAPLLSARRDQEQREQEDTAWKEEVSRLALPGGSPIELAEIAALRKGDMEAAGRAVAALRDLWGAASELLAVLRADGTEAQLAELRAEARRANESLQARKESVHLASQQEDDGRRLHRAATAAIAAVTDRRFKRLAPTVQDIFLRLDPHPSLTRLDVDLDIYYNRGIASPVVADSMHPEIKGDPLLVFSSSQANVTALSYFLAVGWASGADALPFVLLDDPVQSMDDVNALGFADLCRYIRRHRQVVVSTHEHRFASLLERKLTPRDESSRTRVIEFKAWTRDGPIIDQRLVEPQLSEGRARSIVDAAA